MGQPEPNQGGLPSDIAETTPQPDNTQSAFVEVKFNKEIKKLSLDEAATLAQKGMKFDLIAHDFSRLKELSQDAGLSVSEYVSKLSRDATEKRRLELTEKCGGDSELAERLLNAEKPKQNDEMERLKEEFPQITYDTLPQEVKTAAEIKGTGLLFEYLLYEHRQQVAAAEELSRREEAAKTSLGSLSFGSNRSITDAEFLKGVWGK
jgi:hypothetical protein